MAIYDVTGASSAIASSSGAGELVRDLSGSSSAVATSTATYERLSDVTVASSAAASSSATPERIVPEVAASSAIASSTATVSFVADELAPSSAIASSTAWYEGEVKEVWSINAQSKSAGKYHGFNFNSFASVGNRVFGFSDAGVFEIVGTTDAGAPIGVFMQGGTLTAESGRLMAHKGYLVGAVPDGVDFFVADDADEVFEYAAPSTDGRLDSSAIVLGKGIKTRHLRYGLYGSIIEPMELSRIMLVLGESVRNA